MKIIYAIQNVGGINLQKPIGDAIPVYYTLRGLSGMGHNVQLLSLVGRSVELSEDFNNFENSQQIPLRVTNNPLFKKFESGIRRIQRVLNFPYFALFDTSRYYEACSRSLSGVTICHEHNGLFSLGASAACRRTKTPYILTFSADPIMELEVAGTPLPWIQAKYASSVASYTYKVAKKIICVSKQSKQQLIEDWKVNPQKISVLPNGVDVDHFFRHTKNEQLQSQLGCGNKSVIMFVGGFQPWHGLDILIDSFAFVVSSYPSAHLVLVGDGPARAMIEQKSEELGIQEAITITNYVPHSLIPDYLAIADIATLPYPQLPLDLWFSPLKLYEYMAAGKAIVASKSGQIADVIQDGRSGLLVNPGDARQLSEAILSLLLDPEKRKLLGDNARQKAITEHSWNQYIRKLEDIYASAL